MLYAYSGWENANYAGSSAAYPPNHVSVLTAFQVLTEVRNAPTTLKRAAPIAVSAVTVLYVLANIAYVSSALFPPSPSRLCL